jgi:putative transposase
MARPLRLEYPGALYHLTSRGNAKEDIFRDHADRAVFLKILGSTTARFGWLLYAYCLMGNHYHLLAETPAPNLSRGMRHLNGVYTQRFNRRHVRVGHVFQGRFKAILVERETYLLELLRYIALNPVAAALVSSPQEWRWSSYRANAGLEEAPPWLCTAPIHARFGEDRDKAALHYQEFVRAGIGLRSPWSELRGQVLLGTDQFAATMQPMLSRKVASNEVPRAERFAARPALDALLPPAKMTDRLQRDAAILDAYSRHGYTFAEIARHAGLHYSTVSRIAQGSMQQFKT